MNEYYTCKIGLVEYFFEVDKECIGTPNENFGFGVSEQLCFVPARGSVFVYITGMTVGLQEADRVLYSMENFMFPVDECHLVTKDHKYYKTLSEGFGI